MRGGRRRDHPSDKRVAAYIYEGIREDERNGGSEKGDDTPENWERCHATAIAHPYEKAPNRRDNEGRERQSRHPDAALKLKCDPAYS